MNYFVKSLGLVDHTNVDSAAGHSATIITVPSLVKISQSVKRLAGIPYNSTRMHLILLAQKLPWTDLHQLWLSIKWSRFYRRSKIVYFH